MKLIGNDLILRRKLYLILAAVTAAIYSVYCFVITPLCLYIQSDIAFDGTVIPMLLEYLGIFLEAVAVSAVYAVIIAGVFNLSSAAFRGGGLIFVGVTLYKYTANMAMDWVMNGSVPTSFGWDIANVIFFTALETIQLLIVVTIVVHFAKKAEKESSFGKDWYPFGRFYDKKNPCHRAAFFCALTVFISKIFGRLVNDIFSLIVTGLPQKAVSWVIMAVYYICEALFGLICYVVIIFTVMKLMDKLILKSRQG